MSWMTYIEQLQEAGCRQAAMVSFETGDRWAGVDGFDVLPNEAVELGKLINGIDNDLDRESSLRKITASGIKVAGQTYVFCKAVGRTVFGRHDRRGVVVSATSRVLVIGTFEEGDWSTACSRAVGKIADYLAEMGY